MKALYGVETGGGAGHEVMEALLQDTDLGPEQADYAQALARGVLLNRRDLDNALQPYLNGYDVFRLAVVDRVILRMAAYELLNEPSIPPAVTINEAVEIAKEYSTAESGRFVNGVLGNFLNSTAKQRWDPASAPPEFQEVSETRATEIPIEEVVEEGSAEATDAKRFGWTIRSDD